MAVGSDLVPTILILGVSHALEVGTHGVMPHFIPMNSGNAKLLPGLTASSDSFKFNAIPMRVALGMIFGLVCWRCF